MTSRHPLRAVVRRLGAGLLLACATGVVPVASASAQQPARKLQSQREELDRIRQEREQLERRAEELRSTVHDLGEEVTNLDQRADATARIVKTLDEQLATISTEVAAASANIAYAEKQLARKKAALRRRLVDIYKRGPMNTTEALLSAHSFGDLVARYKYLHLVALHDRALVQQVKLLRDRVGVQHDRLVQLQNALEQNKRDKQHEEEQLRALEQERATALVRTKRRAKQTEARLEALKRTEAQLTSAIATLEAERRRAEAARPRAARSASSISTSDYGHLDWPVDGALVYTFGKQRTASNTTIRWNGVGIEAASGAPVRAIAAGKVVSVRQLGTYGLTVIIDHGGGDYSVYGSLSSADVREQQTVTKGQVIGGVGMSDPDYPPHLHFEIRHGGPAVDPATWLREH